MKNERFVDVLVKSVLSGIMIGIGGTVYLSCDNKYIGSFLFSFGLFTIIQYGFYLYTGKVGYIPENKPSYIGKVLLIFSGNGIGTFISSFLLRFTKIWSALHDKAETIFQSKLSDNFISQFILAVFCGLLMYLAVENASVCRKNGYDFSMVTGVVMPVMIFILCGFNHSIADFFYLFTSHISAERIVYILTVMIGNAFGGMSVPLLKKIYCK